jgi:hypothetical protein
MKLTKIGSLVLLGLLLGCQQNPNGTTGTTWIAGDDGAQHLVEYAVEDGLAVLEGDIILGSAEEMSKGSAEGSLAVANRFPWGYWSNRTVPYAIDPKLENPERIAEAIAHWEAKTSLRFVQRKKELNHVYFTQIDKGCMSHLGRTGGRQQIRLSPRCSAGAIIHEIGHAAGLWHEQSRGDRNKHIDIHWENIDPMAKGQFKQNWLFARDVGPYDFDSIMHYDAYAFSKNDKPTITRKDGSTKMGQREGLSPGDVAAVESLYR